MVSIHIKDSVNFRPRPDLSINSTDVESISIELLCNKNRNTLVNVLYGPPKGLAEPFKKFLNCIFHKTKKSNKKLHIAVDFNLNVLDHDNCKKVQNFLDLLFQNNIIPIINKPTRVTKKTATAIDHIITNCFVDTNFKTSIYKSGISDQFPISVFLSPMIHENKNELTYLYKRNINSEMFEKFNQKLYEIDWNEVKSCQNAS